MWDGSKFFIIEKVNEGEQLFFNYGNAYRWEEPPTEMCPQAVEKFLNEHPLEKFIASGITLKSETFEQKGECLRWTYLFRSAPHHLICGILHGNLDSGQVIKASTIFLEEKNNKLIPLIERCGFIRSRQAS